MRDKSGCRATSASLHREESRVRRPVTRQTRCSSARAAARAQSAASNTSMTSFYGPNEFRYQPREESGPASEPSAATRRLQSVLAARRGNVSGVPDLEVRTGTRARLRAFLDGKPLPDITTLSAGLSASSTSRAEAVGQPWLGDGESSLWRDLRAQIRNASRSEATSFVPTSGGLGFLNQHRPQHQPATEEEAEEHRQRVAAARLTLELLEARRIAEAAAAPTGTRRMRQKKNRRNIVDRKCDLYYTIAKLDEEFAAQERSARYYNNIQVQAAKPPKVVVEEEPAPQGEQSD
mmetsp:Transcript_95758/g.209433  ORF Transcript_95758/g.209433 Transcript_95758/m.209433 type:complete len:292 (-) Transcript_95758:218-1093(-)